VKQISSSLLSEAKKKKSELGKGAIITVETDGIKEIVSRHDELSTFFQIYKQRRFHKWLKHCVTGFEAQRDHYGTCLGILKDESWKILLAIQHPPLPELENEIKTRKSSVGGVENGSVNEKITPSMNQSYSDYPPPYNNAIKCGNLTKRGEKLKNWKKRYFLLTPDSIYYFESEKSVRSNKEPLGAVLLMLCSNCTINTNMKKENCFELTTPNRVYYCACNSKEELNEWITTLSSFIYNSVSTPYIMDQVKGQLNSGSSFATSDPQNMFSSRELADSQNINSNDDYLPEISADDLPPPPDDTIPIPMEDEVEKEEWKKAFSPDGIPYYYNTKTKETKWEI